MSSFAALMALSASQTRESQDAVQSALIQRERRNESLRKQQEDRERKQREAEVQMRIKHFENEKREQERRAREEEQRAAKEREMLRREEEQRDALRYGPKKAKASEPASKWPSSNSHARDEVRRRRLPSDDDGDSAGGSPGLALTREEKRERKREAELRRAYNATKRSSHSSGYSKAGRRLPGGAIDVTSTPASGDSTPQSGTQSVKARIAAIPNTLTKLNVVKRDTRTIDEILQDRAKARDAKVLDGEEAREFNDWFGSSKKKESAKKMAAEPSASAPGSRGNTPASQVSSAKAATPVLGASAALGKKMAASKPMSPSPVAKSSSSAKQSAVSKTAAIMKAPDTKPLPSKTPSAKGLTHKTSLPKLSTASATSNGRSSNPPLTKKRPRSLSLSASPPPSAKRRALSPNPSRNSISQEIWKLFGKDRGAYVQRDVLSDDEDMEADATVMEKEEMRSSRIARKEEEDALEEERRHEEEKRRKRKEKEMREKRGY